jgi:hypothetical protein
MEISGYENIEIFINTQSFAINKYENQILRHALTYCNILGDHSFQHPELCQQRIKSLFIYLNKLSKKTSVDFILTTILSKVKDEK